jgi:putative ABC transport system permease protein
MKQSDNLRLALRMFRTRPLRTSLTILGVSVGIGTVFFLVCLGYGLQQTILNRIANADTLLTLDVTSGSDAVQLTGTSADVVRSTAHVTDVARAVALSAQLSRGSIMSDAQVVSVDPEYFRYSGTEPTAGTLFGAQEGTGAVLTAAAVQLFGSTPPEIIGQRIAYTVYLPSDDQGKVQVREYSGSALVTGVTGEQDKSQLYLPLSQFTSLRLRRFDQFKVKVDAHENMEVVRNGLITDGYVVSSLSDTIEQANQIFRIVQIILGLFGLVALIVSAIGMFNTMTIALLERTNEIGIMRSIGITKSDIRKMFLVESMLMGFLGGVAGLLVGTTAGETVNFIMNQLSHRYGGPTMNLFVTPLWFILVIIGFSTVIGFMTGVYPSYRASKLNPLDALRYK